MADALRQYEDFLKRRWETLKSVVTYTRTYWIPSGAVDSIVPARGTAVDLDGVAGATAETDGTYTSALLKPRVSNNPQQLDTRVSDGVAKTRVEITFYVVRPYA